MADMFPPILTQAVRNSVSSAHHSQTLAYLRPVKRVEPLSRAQRIMMSSEHPMPVPVPLPAPRKLLKRGNSPHWDPELYGTGEIKADEVGHHSPPKKRRRLALSCTGDYFTLLVRCPLPLTASLP